MVDLGIRPQDSSFRFEPGEEFIANDIWGEGWGGGG